MKCIAGAFPNDIIALLSTGSARWRELRCENPPPLHLNPSRWLASTNAICVRALGVDTETPWYRSSCRCRCSPPAVTLKACETLGDVQTPRVQSAEQAGRQIRLRTTGSPLGVNEQESSTSEHTVGWSVIGLRRSRSSSSVLVACCLAQNRKRDRMALCLPLRELEVGTHLELCLRRP